MNISIDTSVVFQKNYDALFNSDKRFIVNQGSSRSSKTFSLCQLVIVYCLLNPNKKVSIIRKSFPTLRATVMSDFFEVMDMLNLYNKNNHNKTENVYTFDNGAKVEFFSADDEQKLRGRKRDICWVNEGNELLYDDFFQLNLRTTSKLIVDYNPSDASSWIYDLPLDESEIIKSTYKDNPFLDNNIIKQIENLKETDPELWMIYGLGERATSRKNIYTNWNFIENKPDYFKDFVYGIDFGYNHPTALVKVYYFENEIFVETLIYESYLTTSELIDKMNELGIDENVNMMADYSRPETIEEIKRAGYSIKNANKAVKEGINNVKTYKIYALNTNKDLIKEFENYMWKKQGDNITDEPVKLYDDIMDAIRYAVFQIKTQTQVNSPMLFF